MLTKLTLVQIHLGNLSTQKPLTKLTLVHKMEREIKEWVKMLKAINDFNKPVNAKMLANKTGKSIFYVNRYGKLLRNFGYITLETRFVQIKGVNLKVREIFYSVSPKQKNLVNQRIKLYYGNSDESEDTTD